MNQEIKFTIYSLGGSLGAKEFSTVNLEAVGKFVRENPGLKAKTEEYKAALEEFGKEDKRTKGLKKALPMIKVTGLFNSKDTKGYVPNTFNGLCPFDIDVQDNEGVNWEDLFLRVFIDPAVKFVFFSPSGGIKGAIDIDYLFTTPTKFTSDVKDKVYPYFAKKWNCKLDPSQATFSQGMFLCHDALGEFKADTTPYDVMDSTNNAYLDSGEGDGDGTTSLEAVLQVLQNLHTGQVYEKTKALTSMIAKMAKGGALAASPDQLVHLMQNAILKAPGVKDARKAKADVKACFDWAFNAEEVKPITKDDLMQKKFWSHVGWSLRNNCWDSSLPYICVGNDFFQRKDDRLLPRNLATITRKHPEIEKVFMLIPHYDEFVNEPDFLNFQQIIDGTNWNLFSPLGYTAEPGEWPTIKKLVDHLFGAWANESDQRELIYDWLKELLVNPKQKMIIPCLVSRTQGSAKSTFLDLVVKMFGKNATSLKSTNINREFNSSFSDKLIVCLDELPASQSEELITEIKSLTTAKSVHVNPKGQTEYDIDCHLHFIMASNRMDDFLKVEDEDRRLWIREVPKFDEKKDETGFVARLYEEIPYFLHFLLERKEYHKRSEALRFYKDSYATNRKASAIEANKSEIYHHIKLMIQIEFEVKFIDCDRLVYNQADLLSMVGEMSKKPGAKSFKKFISEELKKEYKNHRLQESQSKVEKKDQKKGYLFSREEVGADPLEGIKDEPIIKSNNIFNLC